MKNTAKIKNLAVIFVLFLAAFSFVFRASAVSSNNISSIKDLNASIDAYDGFIVSVDPDKKEFLLSVTCTKISKFSSICAEDNPRKWPLRTKWKKFLSLFQDPTHIKVSVSDTTQYKSYDTHIPANFAALKPNTSVSVKGDLSSGVLGFRREISAREITIPETQSWLGRLSSIENNQILNLKSQSRFDIKAYINTDTSIVDKDDNEISLHDLSLNDDILSVWGRRYKIQWRKNELGDKAIKKVTLVAEKIILVGKATGEGEEIKTVLGKPEQIDFGGGISVPNIIGELFCKEGLKRIEVKDDTGSGVKHYCTNCGDGICKFPETEYGCPKDCARLVLNPGNEFDYNVSIDKKDLNLTKGFFYGNITINNTKLIRVKFITDNSTKFYQDSVWKGEVDTSFFKRYVDEPYGPKSIRIKGVVLPSDKAEPKVDVSEVLMSIQ
jgi:hypothetical protein